MTFGMDFSSYKDRKKIFPFNSHFLQVYVPRCVLTRLMTKYMAWDGCWKSYSVNKTSKASTTKHQQDIL